MKWRARAYGLNEDNDTGEPRATWAEAFADAEAFAGDSYDWVYIEAEMSQGWVRVAFLGQATGLLNAYAIDDANQTAGGGVGVRFKPSVEYIEVVIAPG